MKSISKLKDDARKHEQKEEWEKAIQVYLQVLRLADEGETEIELPLYNRIGDLCVRLGRSKEAVLYYEQAADRYADAGLFNNAIALCNKALRYDPEQLPLMRKLGQFSASQGFITDARRYFLEYAERQFKVGEVDDALNALEDFANVADDAEVRELLGQRLHAYGRTDEAVAELQRARGMYMRSGDSERVDAISTQISVLDPDAELRNDFPDDAVFTVDGSLRASQNDDDYDSSDGDLPGLMDIDGSGVAEEPHFDAARAEAAAPLEGFESTDLGNDDAGGQSVLESVETTGFAVADQARDDDTFEPLTLDGLESTSLDFGAATDDLEPLDFADEVDHDEVYIELPALDSQTDESGTTQPAVGFDDSGNGIEIILPGGIDAAADDTGADDPEAFSTRQGYQDFDEFGQFEDEDGSNSSFDLPLLEDDDEDEADADVDVDVTGDIGSISLDHFDNLDGLDAISITTADDPQLFDDEHDVDDDKHEVEVQHDFPDTQDHEDGRSFEVSPDFEDDRGFEVSPDIKEDRDFGVSPVVDDRDFEDRPVLGDADWMQAPPSGGADDVAEADVAEADVAEADVAEADDAEADDAEADGAEADGAEADDADGGWTPDMSLPDTPSMAGPTDVGAPSRPSVADDGFIDLAALLAEDEDEGTRFRVSETAPTGDEDRDFAELLSQFKAKVSQHLPTEDAAAHYDLGLAFKEMGLIDEAIAEFQIALRSGHMRMKVYEELGHCFLEKEQYNIAEKVLRRALETKFEDELELLGVYYQLGRAYEGMGRRDDARDAYERVLGLDINFQDVAERLAQL